jgi:pantoate--beta-alanine ligase
LKIVCKITKILHSKLLLCIGKGIPMIILKKIADLQAYISGQKSQGRPVGFVPTMGALHKGHISLIGEAKKAGCFSVCSIFVNPTQFNDKEDFNKYPVSLEEDIALLIKAGCDLLFLPAVEEMYPQGTSEASAYDLGYLDTVLEAAHRPGHFKGVVQIVAKLLDAVQPEKLFMGQKDYQQCLVIKKMLEMDGRDTEMLICPTQREDDGLAMSSRNRRLTESQRALAGLLYQCLVSIQAKKNTNDFEVVKKECLDLLLYKGIEPDYIALADAETLELSDNYSIDKKQVALIAAKVGNVRLIDNMLV